MERDPDIKREEANVAPERWINGGEARNLTPLPPAPGILDIDEDDAEQDAMALADMAAGQWYPHSLVGAWLMTWGEPEYLPFEEWLAARDG